MLSNFFCISSLSIFFSLFSFSLLSSSNFLWILSTFSCSNLSTIFSMSPNLFSRVSSSGVSSWSCLWFSPSCLLFFHIVSFISLSLTFLIFSCSLSYLFFSWAGSLIMKLFIFFCTKPHLKVSFFSSANLFLSFLFSSLSARSLLIFSFSLHVSQCSSRNSIHSFISSQVFSSLLALSILLALSLSSFCIDLFISLALSS